MAEDEYKAGELEDTQRTRPAWPTNVSRLPTESAHKIPVLSWPDGCVADLTAYDKEENDRLAETPDRAMLNNGKVILLYPMACILPVTSSLLSREMYYSSSVLGSTGRLNVRK